jgi:Family of unknown function (DUF6152)
MKIKAILIIAGLAAIGAPVWAHHSAASFDLARRVSVTGVVKEAEFRNPHGHVTLQVKDAHGVSSEWSIDTSAANLLRRRGWIFGKVAPGVRGTFIGHPNKTVPRNVYLREIRLADGTVFGDQSGDDKALD